MNKFIHYQHAQMNSQHNTILPAELMQHIRRFTKHAYVTDEQLYELIKELKPDYSLNKLYQELVIWHDDLEKIKYRVSPEVLNLASTITYGSLGTGDYDKCSNIKLPERFDKYKYKGEEYYNGNYYKVSKDLDMLSLCHSLIAVLNVYDRDPLKDTIMTGWKEYGYSYHHVKVVNEPATVREEFDQSLVDKIVKLAPLFNMNKEYEKYVIQERYKNMAKSLTEYSLIMDNLDDLDIISNDNGIELLFNNDKFEGVIYDCDGKSISFLTIDNHDDDVLAGLILCCYRGGIDKIDDTHYESKCGIGHGWYC